ncbi:MAG: cupredoxin domain-containing protein [Candidatus Sulfotelmatobacter sp.]
MRASVFALAVISLFGGMLSVGEQAPNTNADSTKVIEVSARKYDFDPAEIHVKKGTRVELKVHSVDETHGIKLSLIPEGSKEKSNPGLLFDKPEDNGKVEKGHDQILDFVAQQPGTYEFKCARVCGIHHGRMKGKLIVEN